LAAAWIISLAAGEMRKSTRWVLDEVSFRRDLYYRISAFPIHVRELRNMLERAGLLADGSLILPEHLPERTREGVATAAAHEAILPLADAERRYLRWAQSRHGEDRRSLADKLGVSERTLCRKLKQAGIV
jgi:transcriptional regulator with PAS, ATPase and Fis domain